MPGKSRACTRQPRILARIRAERNRFSVDRLPLDLTEAITRERVLRSTMSVTAPEFEQCVCFSPTAQTNG